MMFLCINLSMMKSSKFVAKSLKFVQVIGTKNFFSISFIIVVRYIVHSVLVT